MLSAELRTAVIVTSGGGAFGRTQFFDFRLDLLEQGFLRLDVIDLEFSKEFQSLRLSHFGRETRLFFSMDGILHQCPSHQRLAGER